MVYNSIKVTIYPDVARHIADKFWTANYKYWPIYGEPFYLCGYWIMEGSISLNLFSFVAIIFNQYLLNSFIMQLGKYIMHL